MTSSSCSDSSLTNVCRLELKQQPLEAHLYCNCFFLHALKPNSHLPKKVGLICLNMTNNAFYFILTLLASCISESCVKMNINLTFYFHTSVWCLKRFSEGILRPS